ncbi:MAG: DUF4160 domain-containing protein [Gemmatimonadetes bacterium]|nr:DUF4160 domain-containing protein [Gemmatimonadota bacterium]MCH8935890.1 DUF4160 domain-containing protein [Gemmatimonadota bacterium]
MPTIKSIPGPFRFFFYSFDCNEPVHIHVQHERATCKFWLNPVALAANHGFSPQQLSRIRSVILEHHTAMFEAWNEHCH